MFRLAFCAPFALLTLTASPGSAATIQYVYDFVVTYVYTYDESVGASFQLGDTGGFSFTYDTVTRRVQAPYGDYVADDVDRFAFFDPYTLDLGLAFYDRTLNTSQSAGLSLYGESYYSVGFDPEASYGFRLINPTIFIDGQPLAQPGVSSVPLPASWALLAGAALAGGVVGRRRR